VLNTLAINEFTGKVLLLGARSSPVLSALQQLGEQLKLEMLPALSTPFGSETLQDRVAMLLPTKVPQPPVELTEELSAGWLELWYQPKVDTRAVTGQRMQFDQLKRREICHDPRRHGYFAARCACPAAGDAGDRDGQNAFAIPVAESPYMRLTGVSRALVMGFLLFTTAAAYGQSLRVNIFPGSQYLAVYAALEQGFYAKQGLTVDLQFTPNSQAQRDGIASGRFEIAHSGVDNPVALADSGKADVAIVAGGSNGMNELIVRPEIGDYADLRGKTMVVDAPDTAYALLLYKMLSVKGLQKGDYAVLPVGNCQARLEKMRADAKNAAAMLNLPCCIIARIAGFRSFARAVDVVGPYQADGVWMLRSWLGANSDTVVKYLRALIEARRWADRPENKAQLAAIIAKYLKSDLATETQSVELAVGPNGGLAKDARFDIEGFRTTLRLRAEFLGQAQPADPNKYLDLSLYERALAGL
jgi:ABC-type nitrate/sulfonate/bicarbonate transport system substrate-binding protein